MPHLDATKLKPFVQALFARVGCQPHEAERVAHYLVEANLAGHDSHGIIRVAYYIDYVKNDQVRPNQSLSVVFQTDYIPAGGSSIEIEYELMPDCEG